MTLVNSVGALPSSSLLPTFLSLFVFSLLIAHFGLKKVLLMLAILVQFTKKLHQRIKPERFDGESCKTEADFYVSSALT